MLGPTAHIDTFARDNLPLDSLQPDYLLDHFPYPERINVGVELTDRIVEKGLGDHTALIGNGRQRTYKELSDWTNRLAHALVENYGVKPGNRVLIRSANNPAMVACWLAATKAGAVVVNTMPMLRAGELGQIVDKAEIKLALCDSRMMDEIVSCGKTSKFLETIVSFDGTANHDAELDRVALSKSVKFDAVPTGRDDVALLGFTSGTTGSPKATMHFHRDILIIADGYAKEVLGVTPDDVFVGSPPLAFTFGLGGLAVFPLRFGATATLLETASPPNMIEIIETYKATICFTAPTAYRAMMRAMDEGADLSSLRVAVSAGETLTAPVFEEWTKKTGKPILDGIGATEMLHIFISNRFDTAKPASTGLPVTGYEAKVVDDNMNEVPRGEIGRLAVRGPTGCRYLADDRQTKYVRDGWNLTGDSFVHGEDGQFHFAARSDDMIISSGYNIAGPEVEAALLSHADVVECGVIGVADEERGQIVEAHVVLSEGVPRTAATVKRLQDHVKATIAPYKYPRSVKFIDELPKTQTGKVQRFRLKEQAMTSSYDPAVEGAEMSYDGRMSYGDYLNLDKILTAQTPLSDAHDEMLFIIQHQVSELWMRLAIHELQAAREAIRTDTLPPAFKMLARVARLFEQLNNAWDVLRTMTPSEYTNFRDALGQSSGFQSHQYRQIEYMIGNRNKAMLEPHAHRPRIRSLLEDELARPSLYDEAIRLLARNGIPVPESVLGRDVSQTHVADDGVMQAWKIVYQAPQTHWPLYELAEKLVDFEDYFRRWRFNHVTTVERVIGFKRGTAGTGGVSYLKRMLEVELFPELWHVRTLL